MKANSKMMNSPGSAKKLDKMGRFLKDFSKTGLKLDTENLYEKTTAYMKGILKITTYTEKEFIPGLMEKNTGDSGKTEKWMEEECRLMKIKNKRKGFGKTANSLNG